MPKDPTKRSGLPRYDQEFLRIIDECGWHVTKVALTQGDTGPAWAYSTGLCYKFGHPEIIIFGLQLDDLHVMINNIGERVRDGEKFKPGRGYAEIVENYDCQFRPVNPGHYKEYVGYSLWFYDNDPATFPMLQCFWPDMKGRFPWNSGCVQAVIDAQPMLEKFTSKKRT